MYLKMAWRNLWRNRRRTMITVASVMMAVVLASTMRCLQLGTYDSMINNVVGYYSGYLQVQEKDYWENRSIDDSFTLNDTLKETLGGIEEVKGFVPRLESFVLVSSDVKTKGAMVIGTDPDQENLVTHLANNISEGSYFTNKEDAVMITEGLAHSLKIGVGDTLIMLGQGYHGASAAGKYPITGIVKFGSPELNKGMVYLPLKDAQWMMGGDVVTSVAIMLHKRDELEAVRKKLESALGSDLIMKDWKEMMPDLVQAIQADNSGGLIMAGVLYLIIAFGLFGTLIMMLAERQHEFGVLVAVGMRRIKLSFMVLLESILIGLMGTFVGFCLSIPVVYWLHYHPIRFTGDAAQSFAAYGFEPVMKTSTDISIFTAQAELVFVITVVLSLYPLYKILKLNPLNAMRA